MLARFEDGDDRLLLGPLERDFVAYANIPCVYGALEGTIPSSEAYFRTGGGCGGLIFERIAEQTDAALNGGSLFNVEGGDLYGIRETRRQVEFSRTGHGRARSK